jgi:hypothetical protein
LRSLQLHRFVNSDEDDFVFLGFNGRLVANSPGKSSPMVTTIKYAQYMRYFSLWFGGILGLKPKEFKNQYGSQSGRIGCTSTASNADIHLELWG